MKNEAVRAFATISIFYGRLDYSTHSCTGKVGSGLIAASYLASSSSNKLK